MKKINKKLFENIFLSDIAALTHCVNSLYEVLTTEEEKKNMIEKAKKSLSSKNKAKKIKDVNEYSKNRILFLIKKLEENFEEEKVQEALYNLVCKENSKELGFMQYNNLFNLINK